MTEKRIMLAKFRHFDVPKTKITGYNNTCQQKILNLQRRHLKNKNIYGNLQLPKSNDDNNSADQ